MNTELQEKLTLRELDDNIAWMRTLFQHYLTWYTFFVTANLLALSWIFTKQMQRGSVTPLSLLFIILNVAGIITAILLARYIIGAERRNIEIIGKLNELAAFEGDQKMRPTFPQGLARAGFTFMVLGLVVIAVLWIFASH